MQPIERVGLFALLFLAVLITAVVAWDSDADPDLPNEVAAKEREVPARETRAGERNAGPTTVPIAQRPDSRSAPVAPPRSSSSRNPARNRPETADSGGNSSPLSPRSTPVSPASTLDSRAGSGPAGGASRSSAPSSFQAPPSRRESSAGDDSRLADSSRASNPTSTPSSSSSRTNAAPTSRDAAERSTERSGGARTYTVAAGDVLGVISQRTLGTAKRWKEIVALNPGIDPDRLVIGAELKLPSDATVSAASSSSAAAPSAASASASSGGAYTVRDGDSLWKIAARELGNGNRWAEIAKLNPTLDTERLVVGAKLTLPSGASRPQAPTTVASNTRPAPRSSTSTGRVR